MHEEPLTMPVDPATRRTTDDLCSQQDEFCSSLPLDRVDLRPDQPRRSMDPERLSELAQSVAERGVLQPIRVRPKGDRFEVISGERRCRAARRVGIRAVPAIVVRQDDQDSMVDALVENIHREDLKAIDRSHALRRLRVTLGLHSWEEVGRRVGLSRMHVHRLLNVTKLPADIQDDLRIADMSEKHVRALHLLRQHPELQHQLFDEMAEQELGGDAAIAAAQALLYGEAGDDEAASATLARNVDGLLSTLGDADTRTLRVHRSRLRQLVKRVGEVLRDLDEGDAAVRTRRREMSGMYAADGRDRTVLRRLGDGRPCHADDDSRRRDASPRGPHRGRRDQRS